LPFLSLTPGSSRSKEQKFTVSAAGGAMPAEGQPNHADPDSSRELLRIADDLNDVRYLIDAAWMAAGNLTTEQCNAMKAVIVVAFDRLDAACDRLGIARGAQPQPEGGDDD
jgi:hypothetical protein